LPVQWACWSRNPSPLPFAVQLGSMWLNYICLFELCACNICSICNIM
jgi:hypothetical protein